MATLKPTPPPPVPFTIINGCFLSCAFMATCSSQLIRTASDNLKCIMNQNGIYHSLFIAWSTLCVFLQYGDIDEMSLMNVFPFFWTAKQIAWKKRPKSADLNWALIQNLKNQMAHSQTWGGDSCRKKHCLTEKGRFVKIKASLGGSLHLRSKG